MGRDISAEEEGTETFREIWSWGAEDELIWGGLLFKANGSSETKDWAEDELIWGGLLLRANGSAETKPLRDEERKDEEEWLIKSWEGTEGWEERSLGRTLGRTELEEFNLEIDRDEYFVNRFDL